MKITRRTFFKLSGASAVGVAMGKLGFDLSPAHAYAVDLRKNRSVMNNIILIVI